VTIEPPDVQYHHSNDSSVQCGPLACRHDSASSDASSAGAAADGAAGHQRLALVEAAEVTIEPPDVQYHHSNDSSVQCGPLACRHDSASSDASSAGAAADGAAGHQRLALVEAAEVCYPLVHRHHGSG
uniref:Os08g0383700 protein n=1 Tax=Macrostomum lignano TaxID=282301 RepID=A0A1I8HYH5_9PLAT